MKRIPPKLDRRALQHVHERASPFGDEPPVELRQRLAVVLVVADHVYHRRVPEGFPRPADASQALIDIACQDDNIRIGPRGPELAEAEVQVAQNMDPHR